MIEIVSGARILRVSPFERQNTPEAPEYDWIRTYIEYNLPELNTQYQASFNSGELTDLKQKINYMHQSLLNGIKPSDVNFDSMENQLNIHFIPMTDNSVAVELTLRPENPAESVIIKDFFGIDESYFPALLSGLDEMINWQD
ncbi:hypothetical protein LU604_12520 [Erwinia tracheiphila]|uniref:Uncharacterized protein n=1 Tax=Erwinia tracheiphila TaxID=65700 RepID=A0A345CQW8_9GAMM|nr:hypothetical protein [Erwinia tracheiphila]AXF75835.1 hypothetical protein AV903_06700 [Erwinia tracheiphila]UIA85511.1 hypothetical protein LU604_12520 [Erwinia tracheiphila]UIA94032.1 hypothetical protein LU632_12085 [Erwinia tracheiphila]